MMSCKLCLCFLTVLIASQRTEAAWSIFFYPFQWIREVFLSSTPAEFSRRIGELEEYNVTFLNDSSGQLWPNLTVAVLADKEHSPASSNGTLQNSTGRPQFQTPSANQTEFTGDNDVENFTDSNMGDKWQDYFEQLLTHDTAFCFSLLVCEISAQPDNFLEYGRRVSRFFETYKPSQDNRAAWWYVNAAELGRKGRSLAECRANYPFCFVDTKQLVALLEVPPNIPS